MFVLQQHDCADNFGGRKMHVNQNTSGLQSLLPARQQSLHSVLRNTLVSING
jgi:hypothetical protein